MFLPIGNKSFKQWLESGLPLMPVSIGLNTNLPVKSKYVATDTQQDNDFKTDKHGNPTNVDSEWIGKKRLPLSKRPLKIKSFWKDKNSPNSSMIY
jgi:hypothetical protein